MQPQGLSTFVGGADNDCPAIEWSPTLPGSILSKVTSSILLDCFAVGDNKSEAFYRQPRFQLHWLHDRM